MAQIPTYIAKEQAATESAPVANFDDSFARSIQAFGGAVTNIGAQLQQREEKRQAFDAETAWTELNGELEQQYEDAKQGMAPDGTGFHDGFYTPAKARLDGFMGNVPEHLRPAFQVKIASAKNSYSLRAAQDEAKASYAHAAGSIDRWVEVGASRINEASYEQVLAEGRDYITNSKLPPAQQIKAVKQWEAIAASALGNDLAKTQDGLKRLKVMLGEGGPEDVKAYQTGAVTGAMPRVFDAIRSAEEDPKNPISPTGAAGPMQVQPATAARIARSMLKDPMFPAVGDDPKSWTATETKAVQDFLLANGGAKSIEYGRTYFSWLLDRYKGDVEAAVIGYNGGEGTADKWMAAGRDDKVLPPPTKANGDIRNYRDKVLRGAGIEPKQLITEWRGSSTDALGRTAIPANSVRLVGDTNKVRSDVTGGVQAALGAMGIAQAKINSGHRDATENARAGGASGSHHMDGTAVDIDISTLTLPQRAELVARLRGQGFTGIGIGPTIIHADKGHKTPTLGAYGSDPGKWDGIVPTWAKEAFDNPEGAIKAGGGGVTVGNNIDPRLAAMPYQDRLKFIAAIAKNDTDNKDAIIQAKADANRLIANDVAAINETGSGLPDIDEAKIRQTLGLDDYLQWQRKRDLAARTWKATNDIPTLSSDEIDARIEANKVDPRDSARGDVVTQTAVSARVEAEATRVRRLRAQDPGRAAEAFPDVKEALAGLEDQLSKGKVPPAADTVSFMQMYQQRQREFGIASIDGKIGVDLIPASWTAQIARTMSSLPQVTTAATREAFLSQLGVIYHNMQQRFGDQTDEVITYVMAKTLGRDRNSDVVVDLVAQTMKRAGAGQPAFPDEIAKQRAAAAWNAEVESLRPGLWGGIGNTVGSILRGGLTVEDRNAGLIEKPTLDAKGKNGITIEDAGRFVFIPKVSPKGTALSDDQAVQLYRATGDHMGIFRTKQAAADYAQTVGGKASDGAPSPAPAPSAAAPAMTSDQQVAAVQAWMAATDEDQKQALDAQYADLFGEDKWSALKAGMARR